MTSVRRLALLILLPLPVALACACSTERDRPRPGSDRVRVGVLPDLAPDALRSQYEGLVRHLAASSGLDVELVLPDSYDDLLDRFHDDRVDLAWFGGLTFLRAELRSGAVPLVMRDVDQDFTSDFLVARSNDATSVRELAGATLTFGPRLSTSGHLMPRAHLARLGIGPETFFSDVRHSSGHDETALLVQDGRIDVGAANSLIVEAMFEDGRLSADRVRVLDRTPPFRNYLWAAHPNLSPDTKTALRDAFLELQADVPAHAEILRRQGAGGYVPVSRSDYDELYRTARSAGLLGDGPS